MNKKEVSAYILLGGNIGNVAETFDSARKLLKVKAGRITKESSLYQTAAWGNTNQSDYLNQVVVLKTFLSPQELLDVCLAVELRFGRVRTKKYSPRTIDIDILFYNRKIIEETGLSIPHPRIPERRFVLTPLNEISPRFVHPQLKKTVHLLFKECVDTLPVNKL